MVPGSLAPARLGIVHVHSEYSHDGHDSLAGLRSFALERGIGFVALTDHAEDLDPDVFEQYRSECALLSDERVALIPGLEYRFAGYPRMHLLALGLTRWIEPATPGEFVTQALGCCGCTIVAHPRLPRYRIPPEVLDAIDAIEVWNAGYDTRYLPDPRAIRLLHGLRQRRPGVVGTAGLDQHDSRNDRETRILLHSGAPADPLRALRTGQFINIGRTMKFDSAVSWGPLWMGWLFVARAVLDVIERSQERVRRALRRRRRKGPP